MVPTVQKETSDKISDIEHSEEVTKDLEANR